ncbi:Protein of uncharacterised function (DUF1557) [uncultured Ruminococcus sp.]|nr:hypothetical protein DWX34_10955 [Ruminococcus sp. AF19-15]SCJ45812.1 Protein of uncharacterised function (DUF1557) [uncultured Ruminococcus sp.]SCJ76064.1 Protein of uncharacterised function (DUF1557) [uncultured Ruminococcus sp.]
MLAIEKIKSGDKVISTDPETMETSPKTVLETYIREVTTLVHLTVNGEEIVTTVDHPFYVKNQGFIKAGELIVGDELLDVNGNVLLVENFDVVGLSIILDTIIKKFDRRKPFEGTHRTVVCST